MKKFSLIAVLILSLFFFVSCGSDDEDSADTATDTDNTTADTGDSQNDTDPADSGDTNPEPADPTSEPTTPTDPTNPTEPGEPTDPTSEPTDPTEPTEPTNTDPGECAVINIEFMKFEASYESYAYYLGVYAPNTGSATDDEIDFEIYSETAAGTYDLSEGHNASYSSCAQCIMLYEDIVYDNEGYLESVGKYYFQQSGTMTVNSFSYDSGSLNVTLENVKLIEGLRKYEEGKFSFEPVENGGCIVINNTTLSM